MTRDDATPNGHQHRTHAAVLGCVVVALALIGLGLRRPAAPIGRFLLGVGVLLAVQLLVFRRALEAARREAGPQRLTLATGVTIHRGAALALLAGVLAVGEPSGALVWAPGVLFAIAASLDAVDGAIARATDAVTEFGGRVDVEVDALTVLVGSTAAVLVGAAPVAFLAVGLARYGFVAGIWLRRRRGRPVYELPSSNRRRLLGAAAMAVIWLALLPIPGPRLSWYLTTGVLVPFLLQFGRDWLAVSRGPN